MFHGRRPSLLHLTLACAFALGALVRLRAALGDDGLYWPDEVFQSLEPAHRALFGYGMISWEFAAGARNWALPGCVAGMIELANLLGFSEPPQYIRFVKVAFVPISLATACGSFALARAFGASPARASLGMVAMWFGAVPIYFAHRAMSENACALPLVWGLYAVWKPSASRRSLAIGASLLGLAVLLRLQCALFCVVALGVLLMRGQRKQASMVFALLVVWAALYGLLDRLTWGQWFQSALVYLRFNLLEAGASTWGTSPAWYYPHTLFTAMPLLALLGLAAMIVAWKSPVTWAVLLFLGAHSCVPHKELRFMLPALPLLFAAFGIAAEALGTKVRSALVQGGVTLASVVSLLQAPRLTFADLGAGSFRGEASAWDHYGFINRLLYVARRQPDLCGLRIDVPLALSGGLSHLHRRVPLYSRSHAPQTRHFNYAITRSGSGAPVIAGENGYELVRIAPTCVADAAYDWRLP